MLSGSTADRVGRRAHLPGRAGAVHARLAAVQPGPRPGLAGGVPDAAGGRRVDAQPGRDVDHHQHLHRARGAGPGDRRVGRRVRAQHGDGPVLGGALVDAVGWRGMFWVNMPVGVAAIVLTALFVPESRAPRPRRLDPVGQMLSSPARLADLRGHRGPGLRLGIGADPVLLRRRGDRRWSSSSAMSRRRDEPLIDLRFFRSLPFSGATADRGERVGGARRVPVPQHAVPAGGPGLPAADRRAVPAADGGGDGGVRPAGRPDGRRGAGPGCRC